MSPKKKPSHTRLAALLAVVGVLTLAPTVFAQGMPGGLANIETKASEVHDLFKAVALIIVAIGAIWCGLKFIKGDPDSWGYVWKFGLGAIIVGAAPQVVSWITT